MASNQKNVAETVTGLIEPVAKAQGIEVWDVEYVREGTQWYLRITIDSEKGIGIDECETFHRAAEAEIDKADPIENAYTLEVSSPGIERELRTPQHFLKSVGEDVCVRLFKAVNGKKMYTGRLASADAEKITLSPDNIEIPYKMISKANIYYDYKADPKGYFKGTV